MRRLPPVPRALPAALLPCFSPQEHAVLCGDLRKGLPGAAGEPGALRPGLHGHPRQPALLLDHECLQEPAAAIQEECAGEGRGARATWGACPSLRPRAANWLGCLGSGHGDPLPWQLLLPAVALCVCAMQYIVLVKPGAFLRAMLAFMRPFVSHKAARKIVQVESLEELGAATAGEVTVQHLGREFLAVHAAEEQGP